MNIERRNEDGEVIKASPDMDLYVVADQVHKNHKADQINELREQARAASEPKVEEPVVEEAKEEEEQIRQDPNAARLTEEDANLVANAFVKYAMDNGVTAEEESKEEEVTTLTDEQAESVAEKLEENVEESEELKAVADLPSNNGVDEHKPEEGEQKLIQVAIDPVTGEHIPVATIDKDVIDDDETFEEMVERVKNSDIKLDDSPFTEEEFDNYIHSDKSESLFEDIAKDTEFDPDTIKQLLEVTNRVMKKEEFNVYKALPEKIQSLVNEYCRKGAVPINTPQGNSFRNMIAEQLVNEFVSNIGMNRIQVDFSKELEEIFDKGAKEISESIVGYTKERSKAYRDAADKMEDHVKKEKLTNILDNIDDAYNLASLKEYAKSCKIKKYDLERPDKIYRGFLHKYTESKFNIYGIDMAVPILLRNINKDAEGNDIPILDERFYDVKDIHAFFIAFCKQTSSYDPNSNPDQHAYMYYTLYNCIFTDINKGDEKVVSDEFLKNVREVINNLRERNDNFGRQK